MTEGCTEEEDGLEPCPRADPRSGVGLPVVRRICPASRGPFGVGAGSFHGGHRPVPDLLDRLKAACAEWRRSPTIGRRAACALNVLPSDLARPGLAAARTAVRVILAASSLCIVACSGTGPRPYVVLATLPHDTSAYTQGLLYSGGVLYESTGEYGRSQVRRVERASGRVLASVPLAPSRFGEGLALLRGHLYQLTWQSGIGYVYDVNTLTRTDSFTYKGEGWGLTTDGSSLIMSDGTATLRFLNPRTFQVIREVTVNDHGSPLSSVNALEYVRGEVFANIYQSDWIVRIDPTTGRVRQWLNMEGLLPEDRRTPRTMC